MQASVAAETRRAYETAWGSWDTWCRWHHTSAAPASAHAVAAYLADRARSGKSLASVKLALAAIQFGHRQRGYACDRKSPAIASVLAGITRTIAKPIKRAPALELEHLRMLLASIQGDDVRACRDRAILCVGFFAALRRSEIASLDLTGDSPVTITDQGLLVHLTSTKTNRQTDTIALPSRRDGLCPASALGAYLSAASISSGPLFRAISKSGRVLDRRLDATGIRHVLEHRLAAVAALRTLGFSPHSLRAGFVTSAAKRGAPESEIQRVSRHKSADVLRQYVRHADPFSQNASRWL